MDVVHLQHTPYYGARAQTDCARSTKVASHARTAFRWSYPYTYSSGHVPFKLLTIQKFVPNDLIMTRNTTLPIEVLLYYIVMKYISCGYVLCDDETGSEKLYLNLHLHQI